MGGFDTTALVIGFVFGGIGFVAFQYGRKMELVSPIVIGLVLMVYPWFVPGALWTLIVGLALTGALWVLRE